MRAQCDVSYKLFSKKENESKILMIVILKFRNYTKGKEEDKCC
jgi:hypothetical protein